jgi:hypothetical protein
VEEYLTIAEVAARLKIKPKTIKNKMASGIFRKGVHYFSPVGLGPRFKWSAIVAWLEEREVPKDKTARGIPMARGYYLGTGLPTAAAKRRRRKGGSNERK